MSGPDEIAALPAPPGPVAALRRVAFLLERGRAETVKVKAFRNAAATLLPLDAEEIARRVEQGTLTELPGIGRSTAEVVAYAVRGEVAPRLAQLEDQQAGPLVSGGEQLREALRGDLHSHSDWSDGGSPIEEMAFTAMQLGHDYQVLTDHSPRLRIANGLSASRLARQADVVASLNGHLAAQGERFRLLHGIEVDILDDGSLDQTPEMLARLDLRVASVHSKLRMDSRPMTRRMVAAVSDPFTDVLGHCTGRLVEGSRGTRPPSEFDARAVFEACAAHDTAVEINARPERADPPAPLIELALEMGCLFSIDSDAHAPGQLDFLDYGCARAAEVGVPADRIVNTWPMERLLAWAGTKDPGA